MDGDVLSPPSRPLTGLQAMLQRSDSAAAAPPTPDAAPKEEAVSTPKPGEDYQAFGAPAGKPLPRVHFFLRDRTVRAGLYADLDSFPEYAPAQGADGDRLILCFKSRIITEVVIEGRHLWPLFDYLTLNRMPWVRELSSERDFEPEASAVVHRILFRPATG